MGLNKRNDEGCSMDTIVIEISAEHKDMADAF